MTKLTPSELQALAHIMCDTLGVAPAPEDLVIYFEVDDRQTVGQVVSEWLDEGDPSALSDPRNVLRALREDLEKLTQEIAAAESRT